MQSQGTRDRTGVSGPVMFARYAFPPNSHGYCGPADNVAFFEQGVTGEDDGGLRAMAREFAGAWPYLELIAHSTRLAARDVAEWRPPHPSRATGPDKPASLTMARCRSV